MSKRCFGTDGIRGKANRGFLRPSVILRISQALGEVLKSRDGGETHRVGLGGDTRISLDMIRAAVTAGLTSLGSHVIDFGVLPTPALAYLTRARGLDMGIMISASHNPMEDNGIKVFDADGFKLPDWVERRVEALADPKEDWTPRLPEGAGLGRASTDETGLSDYMTYLLSFFKELRLEGFKVAVDCANGATWNMAPEVLNRLGAKVVVLANDPDGTNINRDCGSIHPKRLGERVRTEGCDLGVALDGDGDRSLFVDRTGCVQDGDHVMAFLAVWMKKQGRLDGSTVVATTMSNRGLERARHREGITLERTDVGDRYVTARLREGDFSLGGEQSGHIIFGKENHYTGDGVFTALKVLKVMVETGQSLEELSSIMTSYPQVLLNVKVHSTPPFEELDPVLQRTREAEAALGEEGRVLLRYSGTEKLARVMVEGRDSGQVSRLAESIAAAIMREIG